MAINKEKMRLLEIREKLYQKNKSILMKEENLLIHFVDNFSCENLSTIQNYELSFKLLERAREFISTRMEAIEERLRKINHTLEGQDGKH